MPSPELDPWGHVVAPFPNTSELPVDGIWPGFGSSLLSTLDASEFTEGTRVWVPTCGRYFRLARVSSVATSGTGDTEAITAAGFAGGQWLSDDTYNITWQSKTTWSIDESNITGLANDENTGADDTHPLLSIEELITRLGDFNLNAVVAVRWLSDATSTGVDFSRIHSDAAPLTNYLYFQGIPTVVQSGTLTSGTSAGFGNTPPVLEDTALASTWGAAGGISNSTKGRLIQRTTGNKRGWISKDLGSKQARVSWPADTQVTVATQTQAAVSFASGDAYQVVTLPNFPQITSGSMSLNSIRFLNLNITGGGAATICRLNSETFTLCSFSGIASVVASISATFTNCCMMGGFALTGSALLPKFCLASLPSSITNFFGDWNSCVNTFQGGSEFQIGHSTQLNRSGILHLYDTSDGVSVENISSVCVDAIHGSGNTGKVIRVEPGCSALSKTSFSGWDCATSDAHPLDLAGIEYDYADAPVVNADKACGFYG